MNKLEVALFSALIAVTRTVEIKFPQSFKFGASSAAYQVEGAWNVSDKSESIWDRFVHTHVIPDGSTGDVACDSYHLYEQDVQLVSLLRLQFYKFSISWTRLLPSGYPNAISKDGKRYYNNLINALLENGIEPVVALYHWDLPQRFQDLGGWTNPLIVDWFVDYARVAFSLFGNRVKTWITINEPISICDIAYNTAIFAPGTLDPDNAAYICNKNVLLAHAKTWRIYDEEFRPLYKGRLSLANYMVWYEGDTQQDQELAELVNEYTVGRFSHAVFTKDGGWPPAVAEIIANNSRKEGLLRSRLPDFSDEEKDLIKGTADFYALNYYTSSTVRRSRPGERLKYAINGDVPELQVRAGVRPEWPVENAFQNFAVYPEGLRKALNWLRNRYGNIDYLITENGYPSESSDIIDDKRVQYLRDHLEQVNLAMTEDGVNVTRYAVWSLMDNFEWSTGLKSKFGLYQVDFEDPGRKRKPRKSAAFYASVIRTRSLDKL